MIPICVYGRIRPVFFRLLHYLVTKSIYQSVEGSRVEISVRGCGGDLQSISDFLTIQIRDWAGGITAEDSAATSQACNPKNLNGYIDIASQPGEGRPTFCVSRVNR